MVGGEKFLRMVDAYAGYCHVCNEPKLVGRIAVAGWAFHGSVCSHCLTELANDLQRRAHAIGTASAGNGRVQAAAAGTNGNGR